MKVFTGKAMLWFFLPFINRIGIINWIKVNLIRNRPLFCIKENGKAHD